ncbi:hypothetical protein [Nocardia callitridis]|uniref:Uncharacterized protein n=1 Tax=Nocardia callitridis TaxID=648753 RepID=A0ABP9KWX3_9NOCA
MVALLAAPPLGGICPAVANAAETAPAHTSITVPVHQNKPQLETLSADEQAALDCKAQGRSGCDEAAYNRAKQKIKKNEKYEGDRNKQKRGRK